MCKPCVLEVCTLMAIIQGLCYTRLTYFTTVNNEEGFFGITEKLFSTRKFSLRLHDNVKIVRPFVKFYY